ncbi:NADH-quinone oxidoreductase subunit L [Gemmatimonadetes bacterium T265]|nr:NADH-quinone oxidoreductase subunit L [Gemmatimonadetes bacterium T265]
MQVTSTPGGATHPLAGGPAALLWLLPLLPLLGFLVNGALSLVPAARTHGANAAEGAGGTDDIHGGPAHDTLAPYAGLVSLVGPTAIGTAFALAATMFAAMLSVPRAALVAAGPFVQRYAAWMPAGGLRVDWALQLDQLSMLMTLVITGVGTLIHIFSIGYMRRDAGYARYFAYLNLFVAFMLVLVLGANYPVMFIGWEGVGLASYLLIGFWFAESSNATAGRKAFIVNRVGDFGLLLAMFLIFANFNTLDFVGVNSAAASLAVGSPLATLICLFLFLGCAGKSAQIPLYIWLPDAMAGPTPVSALIHAATMVTAGVYLVARSGVLFALAPAASLVVALVGALTALFAATVGLKQWDIKKVLAYSTISQLGYMFMAAGAGAYTAAVFHLVTHAFFKALLFLGAGSVIYALHEAYHATHRDDEDAQDMRNMGGLRRAMPATFVLMWIATLAIAGVPPFAGFFSKDQILGSVFERASDSAAFRSVSFLGLSGSAWLYVVYAIGLATAFITAVYMTRMMLYTFHGPNRTGEAERPHLREAPWVMTAPLAALGVLTVVGGWLNLPSLAGALGPLGALDRWLEPVVGAPSAALARAGAERHAASNPEAMLIGAAVAVAAIGIALAVVVLKPGQLVAKDVYHVPESGAERTLRHAYYVDEAVERGFARPLMTFARDVLWRGVDGGIIDGLFVRGSALAARGAGWLGSQAETGRVGTYAWVIAFGAVVVIGALALPVAFR